MNSSCLQLITFCQMNLNLILRMCDCSLVPHFQVSSNQWDQTFDIMLSQSRIQALSCIASDPNGPLAQQVGPGFALQLQVNPSWRRLAGLSALAAPGAAVENDADGDAGIEDGAVYAPGVVAHSLPITLRYLNRLPGGGGQRPTISVACRELSRAATACSHVLALNFAVTNFGNRDDDEKAEPLSRAKCKKCVRVCFVQLRFTAATRCTL